ncbi:hypothetical protein BDN70DRAFT_872980 [Pholiota conissans]|uniref:USP domain-containing protein n=1 Tax=Pholiota conissans TaxID=109636 RepID=A0A9P5ZAG0_9AGAR|nr:hypothetical protein BDN70DRAFT_872980 [Pholiota conissans]
MQLTADEEEQERLNGELLASITSVDAQIARRVLRKHKGDMEKAADALLTGDRGTEVQWETQRRNTPEPGAAMYMDGLNTDTRVVPSIPTTSKSVIDLTTDDDDMTRAIQMSIESSQPQFGPSERAPHPEWQMVRSNDPVGVSATQEDHTLNEAIQASLKDFKEEVDISPLKDSIREGGRPIALRSDTPTLAYAALVLQALYFVPQVRLTVSNLRLPAVDKRAPLGDPNRAMWNLIELFTNMDLAQLAAIIDTNVIPSLEIPHLSSMDRLPEESTLVVKGIASLIEDHVQAQAGEEEVVDRLFSFKHGVIGIKKGMEPRHKTNPESELVVPVDHNGDPQHNDLVSCLSDSLSRFNDAGSSHDVIITPSEVLTFQLRRAPVLSSSKSSPDPFVYPKTLYLDRFLFMNLALTNDKRRIEHQMLEEIQMLKAHRETLTRSENGGDALGNLRSTIYYYETVADAGDDPMRKRTLKRTADHLKDIMTMIEGKVEDIDHKVEQLQGEVARVYDCPELQKFQYDLRAVLFHTGLPGRKQIYSYVQDTDGVWWKTVDHEVTEVPEETVLSDPTGIHLGAGPYMVFYSRHMSDEHLHEPLVWPVTFSEAVEENNKRFLAIMHPELGIFSSARSSPDPASFPPHRELPIPVERKATGVSRQNSMCEPDLR